MRFVKMNGAGNDFIIINNIIEAIPETSFSQIAKILCQRKMSLGADGLMFVEKSKIGCDYKMIFYNSDGSIGEMCGNGARCIARYGYEYGLSSENQKIETMAGIVYGLRLDQRNYKIKLNDLSLFKPDVEIRVDGQTYYADYIELGNPGIPHAVVCIDDIENYDKNLLKTLGRKIRNSVEFPKGANVNFCKLTGVDCIKEITYERGVEDFTLACGTGSAATVISQTLKKEVSGNNVLVEVPGGFLYIDLKWEDTLLKEIWLKGDTNIVAEGEIKDDNFVLKKEFA